MCSILGVEPENIRIWDYHNRYKSQLLENLSKTLTECTIIHDQCILFEEGDWPQQTSNFESLSEIMEWNSQQKAQMVKLNSKIKIENRKMKNKKFQKQNQSKPQISLSSWKKVNEQLIKYTNDSKTCYISVNAQISFWLIPTISNIGTKFLSDISQIQEKEI